MYVKQDGKRKEDRRGPKSYHRNNRPRYDDHPPEGGSYGGSDSRPLGTINTISGGLDKQSDEPQSLKRIKRSVMQLHYLKRPRPQGGTSITFTEDELEGVDTSEDDPMVITAMIGDWEIRRILVDQGSSAEILFHDAFRQLDIKNTILTPFTGNLIGFFGAQVPVQGTVKLNLLLGTPPKAVSINSTVVVVSASSAYNAILGRPSLNTAKAIVSTTHLLMKFPMLNGVGEVRANQKMARKWPRTSLSRTLRIAPGSLTRPAEEAKQSKEHSVMNCEVQDLRDEIPENHPQPTDVMISIPSAVQRPDISHVVVELKECVSLEITMAKSKSRRRNLSTSLDMDSLRFDSGFIPSAR